MSQENIASPSDVSRIDFTDGSTLAGALDNSPSESLSQTVPVKCEGEQTQDNGVVSWRDPREVPIYWEDGSFTSARVQAIILECDFTTEKGGSMRGRL